MYPHGVAPPEIDRDEKLFGDGRIRGLIVHANVDARWPRLERLIGGGSVVRIAEMTSAILFASNGRRPLSNS